MDLHGIGRDIIAAFMSIYAMMVLRHVGDGALQPCTCTHASKGTLEGIVRKHM